MLDLFVYYRAPAQTVAFVAIAAWAFWKGGGPEKSMAAVLLAMKLCDAAYHAIWDVELDFATTEWFHFTSDILVCAAMVAIALFANRMYTLWMAAFQIIAVNAHLARELVEGIAPIAYVILYIAPSYFQIILLACGIWLHRGRLGRFGPYRDWRTSSFPAPVGGRGI